MTDLRPEKTQYFPKSTVISFILIALGILIFLNSDHLWRIFKFPYLVADISAVALVSVGIIFGIITIFQATRNPNQKAGPALVLIASGCTFLLLILLISIVILLVMMFIVSGAFG